MTYTPDAADGGSTLDITATVDGTVSNTAQLTVATSSGSGGVGLILAWDKDTQKFYLCSDASNPQAGIEITAGTNTYGNDIQVKLTVTRSTDQTATIINGGVPSNSLRVRWYMRSGSLYRSYEYATIDGTRHTATYSRGRTSVDSARSQVGFFGLTHNLDADPPTTVTYGGAIEQP